MLVWSDLLPFTSRDRGGVHEESNQREVSDILSMCWYGKICFPLCAFVVLFRRGGGGGEGEGGLRGLGGGRRGVFFPVNARLCVGVGWEKGGGGGEGGLSDSDRERQRAGKNSERLASTPTNHMYICFVCRKDLLQEKQIPQH